MDTLNLSAALIVYNEEERLTKTLESIKDIASEIIIIDREQDVRRGDSGVQWAECDSQVSPYFLTV